MKSTEINQLFKDAIQNSAGENHPLMVEIAQKCRDAGLYGLSKRDSFALYPSTRSNIGWLDAGLLPQHTTEGKEVIIPHAADKSILGQLASWRDVDQPIPSIPVADGVTVGWKADNASSEDGLTGVTNLAQIYNRLTAYIDVSSQVIMQGTPEITQMIIDLCITAMAEKIDSTVLGVGARTAVSPMGIGYDVTTGIDTKAAPASIVSEQVLHDMEEYVSENASLNGRPAFVASDKLARKLKATGIESGSAERLLKDGGLYGSKNSRLWGYDFHHSNNVSDAAGDGGTGSLLVFGNWKDLSIIQLGGYFILIDKYTLAKINKVRIQISGYYSVTGLRGSVATDAATPSVTDPYEYANAFKAVAIST